MHNCGELNNEWNDRILVIDDNKAIHLDFGKILGGDSGTSPALDSAKAAFLGRESTVPKHGSLEIDSAYQGQQGLEMVRQALREGRPYAMAFVDVRMPPGWDGIETVKNLWAEDPQLEVVLCTAYTDHSWHEMVDQLGKTDRFLILKKPFDFIEVQQLACALTEKWHRTRQAELKRDALESMVKERTTALCEANEKLQTEITDRKRLDEELQKREEHIRLLLNSTAEAIYGLDLQGRCTFCNPACLRLLGYEDSGVLIGRNMHGLIHHTRSDGTPYPEQECRLHQSFRHGQGTHVEDEVLWRADGTYFPAACRSYPMRRGDQLIGSVVTFLDITQEKRAEEILRHHAFHDALTGLPNRALFFDRLDQAIKRARRHGDYLFAVLFLDLDRFKNINDSLGHVAGDKLLVELAQRLPECVRAVDTVARLGGDEFAILADDIKDVSHAVRIAERIDETLKQPFHLGGQEFYITASIGIRLSTTGYHRPEDMLRDADTAMYQAKSHGRACCELFSPEMHAYARTILDLENDLRRAVARQEFRNLYQPIVSLETGGIMGFEALVRWQHPERGLLAPAAFLSIAEDAGLTIPIDWSALREACCRLREWQELFPACASLTMSVNFSPRTIIQPDLIDKINQVLSESGIGAQNLAIEITEDAVIENTELAAATLSELKSLGIRLCIDDFGTGYSSLSYLHRFPFDTLKIDRSFISGTDNGKGNGHITQAIITLAHNLGMAVVAEGVETEQQRARLKKMKCEFAQGYLFAAPMNAESVRALLAGNGSLVSRTCAGRGEMKYDLMFRAHAN